MSAARQRDAIVQQWSRLSRRDRTNLKVLAVFLASVCGYVAVWAPVQARLAEARASYAQQRALTLKAMQVQPLDADIGPAPTPALVSEGASSAGLVVDRLQVEGERLTIHVNGEAVALLDWLASIERSASVIQSLQLWHEKQNLHLEMVLAMPHSPSVRPSGTAAH